MDAQPTQYTGIELVDDMSQLSLADNDFLLEGDFYREDEPVTRGVTLPVDFSEECAFQDFGIDVMETAISYKGEQVFNDLVLPPLLPAVSSTSLALRAESPGAVAQSLLDFLANEDGDIVKVSAPKFAVKADVVQRVNGSLLNCRLKARVYRSSQALVVDFCRRSGDVVAFQQTFERAVLHLLESFSAEEADSAEKIQQSWPSVDLPPVSSKEAEAALDPLLDILRDTSPAGQAQQAEALVALMTIALASSAGAVAVCTAWGREADIFKACASSGDRDVSYPAARLEAVLLERCGQIGIC